MGLFCGFQKYDFDVLSVFHYLQRPIILYIIIFYNSKESLIILKFSCTYISQNYKNKTKIPFSKTKFFFLITKSTNLHFNTIFAIER